MPRKKRLHPQPVEVLEYPDLIVEIYDDDKRPRGRGLHNQYKAIDRETHAVSHLTDLYLSKKPSDKKRLEELLKNRSALSVWLQTTPEGDGCEERAIWRSADRAIKLFQGLREQREAKSP